MPELADIGLIGLAVMGENLALNIESRGYQDCRIQSHDECCRPSHGRPGQGQEFYWLPFDRRIGQERQDAAEDHDDGQSRRRS